MNKRVVDALIPRAYEVLQEVEIVNANNEISNEFRGYISSFGASIAQGSLLSAVSFFSVQNGAKKDRGLLMIAIKTLLPPDNNATLFDFVKNTENMKRAKEDIVNAAIALKLAMNLYVVKKGG